MSVGADHMYFRMREAELRLRAEQSRQLTEARTPRKRAKRSFILGARGTARPAKHSPAADNDGRVAGA